MNSHHNKYVISLISEINCTNLVLLKWISSLRTYSRIHCKREHCKYIVCMNWKPVSLIRPARWLPLPVFLCHFAFDPFVTPIPPQPFVFIKKWWVSAQSELQRPLVGVKQTSSTRSTLHIWSPQRAADLQRGSSGSVELQVMQREAKQEEFSEIVAVNVHSRATGWKNQSRWARHKDWGENFIHDKRDKYHIQLAKCLWHLITLKCCCCSPVIRFTILAPSCEQAE